MSATARSPSSWSSISTASKAVNNQLGHAAGHAVLRQAAEVPPGAFGSTDVAGHLGDDVPAVLVVETDAARALPERDRLQALLDRVAVPAGVGVAARKPTRGLTRAWEDADSDLYRSEPSGTDPGPEAAR